MFDKIFLVHSNFYRFLDSIIEKCYRGKNLILFFNKIDRFHQRLTKKFYIFVALHFEVRINYINLIQKS